MGALTAIHKWSEKDPAKQSYSLRFNEWRYIRYHTGDEELYYLPEDPNEWHNLASEKKYERTLRAFRARLDERLEL